VEEMGRMLMTAGWRRCWRRLQKRSINCGRAKPGKESQILYHLS